MAADFNLDPELPQVIRNFERTMVRVDDILDKSERRAAEKKEKRAARPQPDGDAPNKPTKAKVKKPADPRPKIVCGSNDHTAKEKAVAALAQIEGVYQRGGGLVHVVALADETPASSPIRRSVGSPLIRPLDKPLLRDRLSQATRWIRSDSWSIEL